MLSYRPDAVQDLGAHRRARLPKVTVCVRRAHTDNNLASLPHRPAGLLLVFERLAHGRLLLCYLSPATLLRPYMDLAVGRHQSPTSFPVMDRPSGPTGPS